MNADDFGASQSINAAVMRAHRDGILASTSLIVAGKAVEEAIELAKATPTLAVGLHVVVIGGHAVLPPCQIPHLVDGNGCFSADPHGPFGSSLYGHHFPPGGLGGSAVP